MSDIYDEHDNCEKRVKKIDKLIKKKKIDKLMKKKIR